MPPIDRPEPGVGTPVPEAPGETAVRKLQAGGFTAGEVDNYVTQQTNKLTAAGFKPSEIDAYWGHGEPSAPGLQRQFSANQQAAISANPKLAQDPAAAFLAGWDMSVSGLIQSQGKPQHVLPQNANLLNTVLSGVGQFAGDAPAGIAGFFGGAAAGAAVPGAGETGISEVAGGGAGAAAIPEAARQALLIGYNRGEIHTWQEAVAAIGKATWATAKAGVSGAVGAVVGGKIAGKLAEAGANELVSGGAGAVSNAVAAVTTGGAMSGRVPDAKDFEAGAVIAGLFHVGAGIDALRGDKGFLRVKQNLETLYAQTGVPPWEAATRAQTDPVFRQELMAQDVNGEPVQPNFRNIAPEEPPPAVERGRLTRPEARVTAQQESRTGAAGGQQDEAWGSTPRERLMSARRAVSASGGSNQAAIDVFNRAADELGVQRMDTTGGTREPTEAAGIPGPNQANTPEAQVLEAKRKLNDLRADGKEGTPEWDRWNARFESARASVLRGRQGAAEPAALPNQASFHVATVDEAMGHLANLERSGDNAISPVGAVGKYQIMPGTARLYMGKDFDVKSLFDPEVNREVASRVVGDLFKRYNGNMEAIAAAYNAGPKRAGELLSAPPGSRLRAVPDNTLRGGYRYVEEQGPHAETGLPLETQRYLARARLLMSGHEPETTELANIPSEERVTGGPEAGEGGAGGQPPALPPEGGEGTGEEEGGARKWWARQNEESLTEAMMQHVGEQPGPRKIDLDRTLSQFVSELTPARRIDDRLIKSGEMDRNRDLGAEDMFRQTYASDMRAGVFVRYGAIDPITLDIKPGSKSIMDAARAVKDAGGSMDGWKAYMLAMRSLDLQRRGITSGFNENVAAAWDQPKFHRQYEKATAIWNDVMTSALEYSRDSGVHSQAQIDAMVNANPNYVSFRRIMGDDESFTGAGRGFQSRDALRRMEGSDRQIIDPLMASLDNLRVMIKMADRNRAIGHVVGMIERQPDMADLLKLEDQQTIQNPGEKVFKPYGLPPEEGQAAFSSLLAERGAKGLRDNQFIYFRDGTAEVWTAKDPALAELMRKADSPGQANVLLQTFKWFASLDRAGIVVSPEFPTKVQLRHQITAFVADPLHPPPFLTWLRGIGHVLGQDDIFKDAMAKGAMGVSLADMDAKWLARDMHAIFDQTHTWGGVWNAVTHPLEFAQLVSERMDAAARVGYIQQAQAKGVEPIKAATMSRKAYLDYAERGTAQVANWLSQTVPFFRPHLLGMKQGWEAFSERPVETLKYAALAIAVPTATLYALNWLQDKVLPDGRKSTDLPRWERDSYFITPEIAGVRIKLRYPPNVGFIFGGMMNRVLDAMAQHDPHAFEGWVMSWLKEYIPPLLPPIAQAPIEAGTNHSFFTGKPLIPASMEKASGYMQYTPYTSEAGKALSRALGPPGLNIMGMSPILFDHFIGGWTGTLGQSALHALDAPLGHTGKPWEVADLPFVGSFAARNPGMSAEPIQTFYQQMDDLEAKQADFRLAMRRAEGGSVNDRDIELSAAAAQYAQAIAPIKEAISMQAAAIQGINDNKDMSADEKRQATDQLYPQLVETAKRGVAAIDEIKSQAKQETSNEPGPGSLPAIPAQSPYGAPAPPRAALTPGANRGQAPVS